MSRQLGREIRAERRTLDRVDGPGSLDGREAGGKRRQPNPHTIKQGFKHRSYLGSQVSSAVLLIFCWKLQTI